MVEALLSPQDVARRCGLSRKAVYRAIERGELRASRLCSRLRIRPDDVDAWLQASTVLPGPSAIATPVAHGRLSEATGLRRLLPTP
jgi:excisionase family DNA binding protein